MLTWVSAGPVALRWFPVTMPAMTPRDNFDAAWWSLLWDSGTVALAQLGIDRRYIAVNPAFCRMLDADQDTLLGWPYERLGHPLDLDVELDAWERLNEGEPAASYQRRFRTASEREFPAQVHCHAGPQGMLMQLVIPLDHSTTPSRPSMDDPVWRSLKDLGNALSHDAQEPVRMSNIHVSMIEREPLSAGAAKSCGILTESLHLVRERLKGLVEFARLGRPEIAPVPVPLTQLLDRAMADLTATSLSISCGDGAIRCDPRQATLALRLLLTNAVQFARPGHPAVVRLAVTAHDHMTTVSISDAGIGIPQFDQPRLFRLFATGGRSHPYGTGIGLAICRAIAERHGGRAWIAESSDSGTTMSLSFPM